MSTCYRACRRETFNLVELVLVITIVVSLVSLLLPVVYRSGLNAKSILCSSNQLRLGVWTNMYCQSNKGYLPAYEDGWVVKIAGMGELLPSQNSEPAKELKCPSQEFVSLSEDNSPADHWRGTHYGLNQHITSGLRDPDGAAYPHWFQGNIKKVRDPSVKVAAADSTGGNFFGIAGRDPMVAGMSLTGATYANALPPTPPRAFPYLRHIDGSANFLFIDGHSELKRSWPQFMIGKGTGGYEYWHAEHEAGAMDGDDEKDKKKPGRKPEPSDGEEDEQQ